MVSPTLFSIYLEDLILLLQENKIGCWIDDKYFGIVIYADDILLLSPPGQGLQIMLDKCVEFSNSHNLKFSVNDDVSKSKCIMFDGLRSNFMTPVSIIQIVWVLKALLKNNYG